jgi:hypothetical protein
MRLSDRWGRNRTDVRIEHAFDPLLPPEVTMPSTIAVTAPFESAPFESGPSGADRATGGLRLTRRGRLVVVLLALVVALGAFALGTGRSQAGAPEDRLATERVVVQPGQTLWAVASDALPELDPREAIAEIRALNGLETSVVHPGQALLVPAR